MEETAAQLTFLIPATLAETPPHASSPFHCLETLLVRGDTTHSTDGSDARLLKLFGAPEGGMTARAAVNYFAQYGATDAGRWCIIATPVHLHADHTTLHLNNQQPLLSEEESRALLASCQEDFTAEGWQLDYGDKNTWYLHLAHATSITTTSVAQASGRPLFEQLPQGQDAGIWRRWINDVQMLLHSHPVNDARRGRGEPLINSLWFWGEGRVPVLPNQRFTHVLGGERFVQGLAQISGADWQSLPQGLASLDERLLNSATMVALDESEAPRWDEQWFCPLQQMMQHNSIKHVAFHFTNGYRINLASSMRWRLWRRKRYAVVAAGANS